MSNTTDTSDNITSDLQETLPEPELPEIIPPPVDVSNKLPEEGYKPASQDIENVDQLRLVENFIGSIYGEAKQIDKSNIGESQFTKGLKFNAEQEIKSLRADARARNGTQPAQPIQHTYNQSAPVPSQAPPPPPPVNNTNMVPAIHTPPVPSGDSLILKHEIDEIKKTVNDIKKLYDEFFKLKVVKGKWTITYKDKTVTTTTVAKTWNTLNKLLKNKTDKVIIEYNE